jgi:predicted nucleic acid-binding protein
MFLLYHSDRCNTSETVFHWYYVNDLHTTHAVVCWVTTSGFITVLKRSRSGKVQIDVVRTGGCRAAVVWP